MRVLSVVPRYAVTVGSLQGGTVIGKTLEERGKLHLEFQTQNFCRAENKTKLIGRNQHTQSLRVCVAISWKRNDNLFLRPCHNYSLFIIHYSLLIIH